MNQYSCPNGHGPFNIGKRVFGKLGGVVLGAMAGGAAQNPLAVLLGIFIGAAIGHVIDEEVLPTCPECGDVLRLVDNGLSYT